MRVEAGAASVLAGWLLERSGNGQAIAVVAGVTLIACTFGMLSSLSRVRQSARERAWYSLAMNAGAVWTAALVLAFRSEAALSGCALIGLGVGLAGTTVLEVIERGAVAIAQRLAGVDMPVSTDELHEKIGDVRQETAKALAERAVERRRGPDALPPAYPPLPADDLPLP